MEQLETTRCDLAACTEGVLEALAEVRVMVLQGVNGSALCEKLRFADDLMNAISAAVNASTYDRSASQAHAYLAGQVNAFRALIRPVALSI